MDPKESARLAILAFRKMLRSPTRDNYDGAYWAMDDFRSWTGFRPKLTASQQATVKACRRWQCFAVSPDHLDATGEDYRDYLPDYVRASHKALKAPRTNAGPYGLTISPEVLP